MGRIIELLMLSYIRRTFDRNINLSISYLKPYSSCSYIFDRHGQAREETKAHCWNDNSKLETRETLTTRQRVLVIAIASISERRVQQCDSKSRAQFLR